MIESSMIERLLDGVPRRGLILLGLLLAGLVVAPWSPATTCSPC